MALYGVDVSNWQGVGTGDGWDFVIAKATEGTGFVDPTCDAHYQRAKSKGQRRGVYHFARPDFNDAKSEADFFINNTKGYVKDGILVLDWEVNTWNVDWAKTWLDRVYSKTGVRPLIYMSASVVTSYDWSSVVKAGYGLWIAGYPNKYNVSNPAKPKEDEMPYSQGAWPFIAMWQYSSSAGTLDRNIFYGDVNAWNAYAGRNVSTTTPKEEPKEEPKKEAQDGVQEKQEEEVSPPKPAESTEENDKLPEKVESTDKGLTGKEYLEAVEKLKQSVELVEKTAKGIGVSVPMSNKVYDALKLVVAVVLPTISALYLGLSNIWGFGFGTEVDQTIQLLIAAINAVLGIAIVKSSVDYHKGDV